MNPNGEWVLFVADMEAGDIYTLNNWGLEITGFTPPTIVSAPANTSAECSSGSATFSVSAGGSSPLAYQWRFNSGAIAGATSSSLTLNHVTFANAGNYDVVITNNYRSTTSSVATLTVQDLTAPVADAASLSDVIGQCSATLPPAPTATDSCEGQIIGSPDQLGPFGPGNTTITWTFTDSHGNHSSQTQVVRVHDTIAPTVLTKNIDVNLDASGHASIIAADVDNGSSDNCSIVSRVVNPSSFDCTKLGANIVILTVTDSSGNPASAPATVTVHDVTSPTVLTQNIDVNLDASGHVSITAAQVDNGSSDNCAITNRVVSPRSEERRVGEESRSRLSPYHYTNK